MQNSVTAGTPAADMGKLLAAAPHRPLFLAGTIAVMLTMLWWTLELAALRWGWQGWPQPAMLPRFAHAMAIQYGLFPLFMFGFLMTTFPRWMNGPQIAPWRYLPVAGSVLGGYILVHAGFMGVPGLIKAGFILMLIGYIIGIAALTQVLARAEKRNKHGWSTLSAFCVGALGLLVFVSWLLGLGSTRWAWFAVKLGTYAFLLPIYVTVCHRMLPFFTRNIVGHDYVMWRPNWSLPVIWVLLLGHFYYDWQTDWGMRAWFDLPLAFVFLLHWLKWQPWRALRPGLLAVLHLGFAWLPLAFLLFCIQDLVLLTSGKSILGLAPLHALAVGFFGSLLVGMVTRVTHGHAGKPLQMGVIPWISFALLQVVVIIRIAAELGQDLYAWSAIAGAGWLLAFLPWVVHGARIYLAPRVDGRPG